MSERVALVTLAIGADYADQWHRVAEPGWREYAGRHGYDVVCLEEPLDTGDRAASRSPAWQKCLVLEQPFAADYDRVVWVDADIAINPAAPPIVSGVPPELVGAVDEYATPTPEHHRRTLEKLYAQWRARGEPFVDNLTARSYYEAWDLPPRFDEVVQTGVMVLSPAHHSDVLRRTYDRYDCRGVLLNYEMRPLSWELLDAGLVSWLDPRFNYVWGSYKALHFPFLLADPTHEGVEEAVFEAMADVHFLHFAGIPTDMDLLAGPQPKPDRVQVARRSAAAEVARVRSPVAMAIYRRPDTTALVLDAVRQARPAELLVFANAPRAGDPEEERLCSEARAVVTEGIDWDCRLRTRFNDEHLPLREQIEGGLDWVFDEVETAIVLEDDCVPDPTFFAYCDELLERYADDERVFAVSGNDFGFRGRANEHSYAFSRYPLIWGWATWRRAWSRYDRELSGWSSHDVAWLEEFLGDPWAASYWGHQFDRVEGGLQAWDYVWVLSCWLNGGLTAVPTTNLVSNVGFRGDATHTRTDEDGRHPFAAMATAPLPPPLRHPPAVERDVELDRFLEDVVFSGNLRRTFEALRAARGARQRAAGATP